MEDETENLEAQETPESEEPSVSSGGSGSIMWLAVLVAAAVVAGAGGFVLARFLGAAVAPVQAQAAQAQTPAEPEATGTGSDE